MGGDPRLDDAISRWLEETANARLPERVLEATFERTRASAQRTGWRARLGRDRFNRFAPALGGAVVVVGAIAVAAAVVVGSYGDRASVGGPAAASVAVIGTWENDTDLDGGHQTMEVVALANDTYGVTIRDDLSTVCGGVASTMTGVAETRGPDTFVIARPLYTCDDGSRPEALSGPPLDEQLRDLAFTYDLPRDQLYDSLGLVWSRVTMGP